MNLPAKSQDSGIDDDSNNNEVRDSIDMAKLDLDKQKHQETIRKNKADEQIKREQLRKKPTSK